MNFQELVKERYSCRNISNKPVEPAIINKIIDAAIKAPTAVNKQPIKIFQMQSEKAKQAIAKSCASTFGASTFLIVGYKLSEGWVRSYDNRPFADIDGDIVATHIMLQVSDLGLVTTWIGNFDAPLLKQMFPEMNEYELIALFPIGYPADNASPSKRHFERKGTDEILVNL